MPVGLELGTEARVVVDLTVVGDPHGLVLVRHGLVSGRDVDDAEPPMAEADRPVEPEAFAVRSSMEKHVAHALHARFIDRVIRIELDDTCNATHQNASL